MFRSFFILGLLLIGFVVNRYWLQNKDSDRFLVVYSSRKEELVRDLFDRFYELKGIRVKFVTDEPEQLMSRTSNERDFENADVFLFADVINLIEAKNRGLLQQIKLNGLHGKVAWKFRDIDDQWFGVTKRARVIVYNKEKVDPQELSTYLDLADRKWVKSILVRSSSSPYNRSLIAFMINVHGEDKTEKWIKGLVKNMVRKPSGGDIDQIYAVAAGEGKLAIVNSYYVGRILNSKDQKDIVASGKIGVFFPSQHESGTMVNISGLGLSKRARHVSEAMEFFEFMLSDEAQAIYSERNQEYPVVQGAHVSDVLLSWGAFNESNIPLYNLGKYSGRAVALAEKLGWR